ncbi:mechanosensitive ion channel domain-containing protein [uncultured Bacteroides sp.]|uniref:mechanosensitive ion channel family protein n=1 Tax=uncultured Bacteroides sp. TaxID=162156 RepID=UPI002AAA7208|nr:mechanosensitive ion channel domain-containing protein [uncultured Bacteroides sp.]
MAIVEKVIEDGLDVVGVINNYLRSLGLNQQWADALDQLIAGILLIGLAWGVDLLFRNLLLNIVNKLVKHTKATWDDIVFDRKVMINLSRMLAPIVIYLLLPVVFPREPATTDFLQRLCLIYIVATLLRFVSQLFAAMYCVYSDKEQFRDRPLKGLLQTAQVVLFFVGGISIVSILINQSPVVLLTGLGASAAVLMLVFKDSIMGFVSGIQLSANNMLRVGDWIVMPKYGADGTVIEVTLNTVKVRNWDNTITTIPPYALVSDSFQNWRGMEESGGRRIKRSINIDMNSVKFCTEEMLKKYRKIQLLKNYVEETEQQLHEYNENQGIDSSVVVNGRRQTNLGVFRAYLNSYLNNLPVVNKNMTCMVRHLQPTEQGIPIELYFFSSVKAWVAYEGIQADIFDHVLAIIPEFELRVFQNPTGNDFRELKNG